MSKYISAYEFRQWVSKYYQEFCGRDDFIGYAFGTEAMKRRGIIVINKNNGKVARSYCHPDDEWDWETGIAVAYAHYMGVEVPQVEKSYFIEDLVGKEVRLPATHPEGPTTVFVTPYTKGGYVLVVNSRTSSILRLHPHTLILEHDIKK